MKIPDETLEALKWIALVLMIGDHVNKYLFNETLPVLFELGRTVFPLFAFILGYNLARPGMLENGGYIRTAKRLFIVGMISSLPFIALGGGLVYGWWPLNVLFALTAITVICYLIERGGAFNLVSATIVFIVVGGLVEFLWQGIAFGVCSWGFIKYKSIRLAVLTVIFCSLLYFISKNLWSLIAVFVVAFAMFFDFRLPKYKYFFYVFYPAHFCILLLIRIPMAKAGYFFL